MKSIYGYSDFRKYLNAFIEDRQLKGGISRLAEAAECQRSHISRVLTGQLQLTMDQAYRLARFFQFDSAEQDYFLKLVEWDRAADSRYRSKIEADLREILSRQEDLSGRLKRNQLSEQEMQILYYSGWHWSAIHILTSIPGFQTPESIAKRLGLSASEVEDCLKRMADMGLVSFAAGKWKFTSGSLHLSKKSPLNPIQHGNWRSRAVLDSQNPATDGLHYTVVQSLSEDDRLLIKQKLLSMLDEYARIAEPSKPQELVCLALDFFKV